MRYQELFERHPDVMLMYHGTHSDAAARIAKKGLVAKPQSRHYQADDPSEYHLASLTGAYFTDQFQVAVGYAYKASMAFEAPGWCGIILANVPLTNAVPDEDVVTSAMEEAIRAAGGDSDRFVRAFHRNLVQERPVPMRPDLALKLRNAYEHLEHAEDDEEFSRNGRRYRRILDQITRAYAAMVFDTHPVYLGGNHTVRLPRGLPVANLVSVSQFSIKFEHDDPSYPYVTGIKPLLGDAVSEAQLADAVNKLNERDYFRWA